MVKANLYYDKDGVKVTSKELILSSSRYKLSDLTAVCVTKRANYRRYPILSGLLFLLVGFLLTDGAVGAACFLFGCAIFCFVGAAMMKTKYALRLRIGWGETIPLISTNQEELEEIRKAVWDAKTCLEEGKEED